MTQTNTQRPAWGKALVLGLLLATLMTAANLMLAAKPAHADATFTVTRTDDFGDPDPGDGECGFFAARGGQACSLRAAIQEANGTVGADVIKFGIPDDPSVPGNEAKAIKPVTALPPITEAVTIDGYSQSGASPNTLAAGTNARLRVGLDGSGAGQLADGLVIKAASNVVIKGLAIHDFQRNGILIFKGVDDLVKPLGNKIEGNFIGSNPTSTVEQCSEQGNFADGVLVQTGVSNTVGGTLSDKRNLICGNGDDGVGIGVGSSNNKVLGNLIGTTQDGVSARGNSDDGVSITSNDLATGNTVGDGTAGGSNTIAFNNGDGVRVTTFGGSATTGNRVLTNSIFSNDGLGIDLNGDGPNPNDPKDPDTGPNNLQNFPILTSATTTTSGATTVQGTLNSTPGKTFNVQFFSNPSGENEGKKFIGKKAVTTDANGNVSFSFAPGQAVPAGQNVTATATSGGNTSEFSDPKLVTFPPQLG